MIDIKKLTLADIENLYTTYEGCKLLMKKAEDVGYAYLRQKGWNIKPKAYASIRRIYFDDDETFCIEWEGGCGCCPPDSFGEEWLPLYALCDTESFLVEAKLRGDFDNDN